MAKLGEICTVVSGSTPKTSVASYWDGSIKWITPAELNNESFYITDSVRHITEEGKEKTGLSSFPAGTVILSSRAPIGKTAIAGCEMCCNQGFKNLICSKKIYNEYLYFFLKSKTNYLNSLGRGATFKEISKTIVENIEVPLPDINQQKGIAEKFKKLEELISLRKQQLFKLDELVKARFVEMFGNSKDNKKEWNRVPLKKVAEVRGRVGWKGYKKEDLQESGPLVLGATHLTENGNIDLSSPVYLSRDKYEESPEIMLHRNDLVFTQRGNTIGKVGLVKEDIGEATINPCVLILRPTNIHPIYLDVYFVMDEVKKDMWRLNAGSAQPMITQKGISEYLLMLPPIELQNQFAAFVERVDKQKQTIQQSLEKLELMKKALMQEYFG